jgi:site-specific DNA recombinase
MDTTKSSELKYFLYARKSSEDEERQIQSIDDQKKWLKDRAALAGIKVSKVFTEAKSAKKPNNRPVFTEMMARIEKGEANGILCWQINRLSRNPIDSAVVQWMLQQGTLKSIRTYDREYLPEDNTLLFSVESGMANQYIIELRANTQRGIQSKIEKGWMPGLAPIGYCNDKLGQKGDKKIVPDPERFDIVRKVWDLMLTGNYNPKQVLEIATNDWHLKTRPTKKTGGVPISQSGIYRLLNNIFYAGMFEYNGKLHNGKHLPMVTMKEFERVQALMGLKGKPQPQTREFAFTGNIRCGECGCLVTAETKTKFVKATGEFKDYTYYRCTHRKTGVKCSQKPIRLIDLEAQMENELRRFTIKPIFRDWALRMLAKSNDTEIVDRTKIHEALVKDLENTQKQLDNLTKMRYRDLIDDGEFKTERQTLQNHLSKFQQQRDETENRARNWLDLTEKTFNFACYARRSFLLGDVRIKREIFAALGSHAVLTDGILEIVVNKWFQPIVENYAGLEAEYEKVRTEHKKTIDPVKNEETVAFATVSSTWGE